MPGFIQTVAAGVRAIPGLVLGWLLRKGREVVIGAALGALLGFFWEDVDAWVRSLVQPGNLSGTYVIASFVYPEEPGDRPEEHTYALTLKHGGNRIFGVMESTGGKRWNFNGYIRNKFMALAYGGVEEDGLGTGTYSFQRDIRDVLWGYVTQVECIGLEAMYTRCPALMYRMGQEGRATMYKEFMTKSCEKITIKTPDKCQDLKAKSVLLVE